MSLLEVKDLTIMFGGLCAVDDFNLSVEKGELVAVIGPNGAGKTTVLNMLTGIYRPTSGTIRLDGPHHAQRPGPGQMLSPHPRYGRQ